MSDLTPFFAPRSIAVIGAGERPTSSGGAVMQMIRNAGYAGTLIPVNPRGGEIFGLPARASIADVVPAAELAVIVVRPDLIPTVVREAGQCGHKHLLILPGGFAEAGPEGVARDREVRAIATELGVTIAGPNCAGIISLAPGQHHAPTLLRDLPPGPGPRGGIALISQSGALAEEVIAKANERALPVSTVVSVGNAMQLGIAEYLDHVADDDLTSAVLLYVESVADPAALRGVARRVAARKPLVALFGGATGPGGRAANAHTGATINSDAAITAFCDDCGIVRVGSLRELLLAAKGFGFFPGGIGRRVLVLSNSGGPGVLATDAAAAHALDLVALPNRMADRLRAELPAEASVANPTDLLADAHEDRFGLTLEEALAAGPTHFDAIIGIHVVPFMVDAGPVVARLAELAPAVTAAGLPYFHTMMGTLEHQARWFATMEAAGVPMFNDAEAMAECAAILARYPVARARALAGGDRPIALQSGR